MMDNPTINYLKRLFQEEEDSSATDGKEWVYWWELYQYHILNI
jgi:hypothetical protein